MNNYHFKIFLLSLILGAFVTGHLYAQNPPKVWYAKAGAHGNGQSVESPLGSSQELEELTQPGDIIMLLSSDIPLDGGLSLKDSQELIGLLRDGNKPVITNSDSTRTGGAGISLGVNNRIRNLRIENTFASGIFGLDATDIWIENVEVVNANTSGSLIIEEIGQFPQAGIMLVNKKPDLDQNVRINSTDVIDASGAGIMWISRNGAKNNLRLQDCKLLGGSIIGRDDFGLAVLSRGEGTENILEVLDADINGRMSEYGRNVFIAASAQGVARAWLRGVHSGQVGQDGVLGAVISAPATVTIDIDDCLIEKAESNIEGAMLDIPPFIPSRATESSISINVENSIIRDPVVGPNTKDPNQITVKNFSLGPTNFMGGPKPSGRFILSVRHCEIVGGKVGLITSSGSNDIDPNGIYQIVFRDNIIQLPKNDMFVVHADHIKIDARENCWKKGELPAKDIGISGHGNIEHVDFSDPIPCFEMNK